MNQFEKTIVLKAPVALVYKAFTTPQAMAKWFPPNGFIAETEYLDIRPGGSFRSSFINFATGFKTSFFGKYLEVVENKLLVYTDEFDSELNLPGVITTRVEFSEVICGTQLHILQQNLPLAIPTPLCYLGWQESLHLLKLLVEAQVPN